MKKKKTKRKLWQRPSDVNGPLCLKNAKAVIFEERRTTVQIDLWKES